MSNSQAVRFFDDASSTTATTPPQEVAIAVPETPIQKPKSKKKCSRCCCCIRFLVLLLVVLITFLLLFKFNVLDQDIIVHRLTDNCDSFLYGFFDEATCVVEVEAEAKKKKSKTKKLNITLKSSKIKKKKKGKKGKKGKDDTGTASSLIQPMYNDTQRGELIEAVERNIPEQGTITCVEVKYKTPGYNNEITVASATVLIPPASVSLNKVIVQTQGTQTKRYTRNYIEPYLKELTQKGYTIVLPYYVGLKLGVTDNVAIHNFMQYSDVYSVVDALRATFKAGIQFSELQTLDKDNILLTGYSQGGYVCLMTHREMEERHSNEFTVKRSLCAGAPYSLSNIIGHTLLKEKKDLPFRVKEGYSALWYLPYLILAYRYWYQGVAAKYSLDKIFKKDLVDNEIDKQYNMTQLPFGPPPTPTISSFLAKYTMNDTPSSLFADEFYNESNGFLKELISLFEKNEEWENWTPKNVKNIFILHCKGDQVVPIEHSKKVIGQLNIPNTNFEGEESESSHSVCSKVDYPAFLKKHLE